MQKFPFILKGKCIDYLQTGEGVVTLETGEKAFVPSIFLHEEGEIEIIYKRNGVLWGKIKKLYSLSPERIIPRCKVPTACGGCSYQALSYQAQKKIKENFVRKALKDVLEEDTKVYPCMGMEHPYFYRNKGAFPLAYDAIHHKVVAGFYRQGTHQVVPIEECSIQDKRISDALKACLSLINEFHLSCYEEEKDKGFLKHLVFRSSYHQKDFMVVFVGKSQRFPKEKEFIYSLRKRAPFITTIILNVLKEKTNVILGKKEKILFGPGYIEDTLCGCLFRISSRSFYQVNPFMTEKLYQYALKEACLEKEDTFLDAYCGIGTIGLIAASSCKEVIGIEVVEEAIKDAKANALRNKIRNYSAICGDCPKVLNEYAKEEKRIDVLLMDPPRKGSTEEFLNSALLLKPRKIIYISCNPITLGRDVKILQKEYHLSKVQPFDLFPMTPHVEAIAVLHLRSSNVE